MNSPRAAEPAHEPSTSPSRFPGLLAAAAIIALVAALILPTLPSAPTQPNSDDGFYLLYMKGIASNGLAAIPGQFDWYLRNKDYWIFPPPSRVGFSIVSALWSQFFGTTLDALKQLSLASFLALIAVQFYFARRHFGEWRAVLIAALTAFSPLYLGLSRLALTDAFISLCQVTTIWMFFELVRAPRSWPWRVLFVLGFAFTILTKEIGLLLAIPFTAFLVIERFRRKRELPILPFVAVLALPPLIAVAGWIAAAGSFATLNTTMNIVLV